MSALGLARMFAPNVTAEPQVATDSDRLGYNDTQVKATEILIVKVGQDTTLLTVKKVDIFTLLIAA
jgi:hypothetical protein